MNLNKKELIDKLKNDISSLEKNSLDLINNIVVDEIQTKRI